MIEGFRSRISFQDELKSLTMFKHHLENFLGFKDKARELGVEVVSFDEVDRGK